MSGHTPGPWTLCRMTYGRNDELIGWHIAASQHGSGAPICEAVDVTGKRMTPETHANARLIAAAPELLEALQNAVGVYGETMDTMILQRCRAAIASATGAA